MIEAFGAAGLPLFQKTSATRRIQQTQSKGQARANWRARKQRVPLSDMLAVLCFAA